MEISLSDEFGSNNFIFRLILLRHFSRCCTRFLPFLSYIRRIEMQIDDASTFGSLDFRMDPSVPRGIPLNRVSHDKHAKERRGWIVRLEFPLGSLSVFLVSDILTMGFFLCARGRRNRKQELLALLFDRNSPSLRKITLSFESFEINRDGIVEIPPLRVREA